jgi:hypothetical protein
VPLVSPPSGSFLKKRTKKLLVLWAMAVAAQTTMPRINRSLFASRVQMMGGEADHHLDAQNTFRKRSAYFILLALGCFVPRCQSRSGVKAP